MAMKGILMLACALALVGCNKAETDKANRPNAPFGLAKGDLIPDIQIGSTPDAKGYAVMREVPKPEAPFVSYAVIVRENIGICQVTAVSGNFAVSNENAVRGRLAQAGQAIQAKYGPPTGFIDNCDNKDKSKGQGLCKPSLWAQAISRGVRQYAFIWGSPAKPLNADIKHIRLEARTNEVMEPYIRADYVFTNEDACTPPAPQKH